MVHEFGHFITARKFNMKVTEFFVGFGKRIFSFRRGETEYGLKAILAGGYCKIAGMTPNELMPEGEEDRAFHRHKGWQRTIVLLAGSIGHLLISVILLFALFVGIGEQTYSPIIDTVPKCFTNSCTSTTPAYAAGLQPRDAIVKINGSAITDINNFSKIINRYQGRQLTFEILRNHKHMEFQITPVSQIVNGKQVARIGITINSILIGFQRDNPFVATAKAFGQTGFYIKESLITIPQIPTKIPAIFSAIFSNKPRDPNGPIGVVGVARVAEQTFSDSQSNNSQKIAQFILLIVGLNVFVGIFNLIPLLPLDGGHILIAAIDSYRRRKSLRTGKAVESLNLEKLTPFVVVVFGALVVLAILLLIADIVNPVHI